MQIDTMATGLGDDTSRLPAALDTGAADAFLGFMQRHASAAKPVRFDASGVEILTVAGVQVMLAVARDHGPITVVNPSEAFLVAFGELGIDWTTVLKFEAEEAPPAPPQDVTDVAAPEDVAADQISNDEPTMTKRIMTIDDSKTMRDML